MFEEASTHSAMLAVQTSDSNARLVWMEFHPIRPVPISDVEQKEKQSA